MKLEEKKKAIALRKKGESIKDIAKKVGVAKSSVSMWVRDIELTNAQKKQLFEKGHTKSAIEKRRHTRLTREKARRQIVVDVAEKEIRSISQTGLFLIGVSLYWAEGSKTKRGTVEFSNSDPRLIEIMMRFFKEVCNVPDEKFRGHVHLHEHLSVSKSEKYWQAISNIPHTQFFKTSIQHNKASKGKKDSLLRGTFAINISSTELHLKIRGWMQGISNRLTI